jgi:hypothetical protein
VADRFEDENASEKTEGMENKSEDNSRALWGIAAIAAVAAVIAVAFFLPMFTRQQTTVTEQRVETMPTQERRVERETHLAVRNVRVVELYDATAASPLVGERIRLESVPVLAVERAGVFWVGETPEQAVLVVMEQGAEQREVGAYPDMGMRDPAVGGQLEGTMRDQDRLAPTQVAAHEIKQGDRVVLSGTVRSFPSMEQARERWDLDAREIPTRANTEVYVTAETVWRAQAQQHEEIQTDR